MLYHRKSALRALFNPPLPISTLIDMLVDGRVPPPDAYNGRVPLWTDATVEAIKQRMIDAPRPSRRQRKTKPAIEAPKPRRPSKTTAHGVEAP